MLTTQSLKDQKMNKLTPRQSADANIEKLGDNAWRLIIQDGERGTYRLAQLDDYTSLPRRDFLWNPPLTLSLRARVSVESAPGTWGFGLWNDPFSISLGVSGAAQRLPALPNAAWFFYASDKNYLSFRNDKPASGFLAATFQSPRWPAWALAPALLGLPLLATRPSARIARHMLARVIQEDSARLSLNVKEWHTYELDWLHTGVRFAVDGETVHETVASPIGPLGLVLWVDNQYAAFSPTGDVSFGTQINPSPIWLELEEIKIR